jgi:hypothetical protein
MPIQFVHGSWPEDPALGHSRAGIPTRRGLGRNGLDENGITWALNRISGLQTAAKALPIYAQEKVHVHI